MDLAEISGAWLFPLPRKNDRLDLVFALVGDTPLEYQRTPVTLSLAIPLKRFSFHGFYCSKEVGHARVNPLSI